MKRTAIAASIAIISTAALADVKETVEITITGGQNPGKYQASSDKGGCSAGLAGPGSFGNQLSDPKNKDPKAFNSLQLVVPDAKKAASGTGEFMITVGFGPLMSRSATYTVDTTKGKKNGSGTVTVDDKGSTAKVKFSASTPEGVKLEGTIDCKSVTRAG
jgi:hypothetical protein